MQRGMPIILWSLVWWLVVCALPLRAAEPPPTAAAPVADTSAVKAPAALEPESVAPTSAAAVTFSTPREAAIAKTLKQLGVAGEIASVPDGEQHFLALVTAPPTSTPPQGMVLLVPAVQGAVSDPLILALAAAPPASGWLTMAVQPPANAARMPVDAQNAFCARITASLKFLQARGAPPVVLVGVGRSFEISRACLADQTPGKVAGLVGFGRWLGALNPQEVPLLDIPPTADPVAVQAAHLRAVVAVTRAQTTYRQIPIDALDERFEGAEQEAAKRLRGWLIQLPRKSKE